MTHTPASWPRLWTDSNPTADKPLSGGPFHDTDGCTDLIDGVTDGVSDVDIAVSNFCLYQINDTDPIDC
ncbi:hypothetical protein ORJ04_08920 [Rheinheimera baltica]|uniref:Uncharacterized protein n=1 Tax=Rheinheimera baltica TaxID=67576 RepID=A0ABT9HY57_9GAMM|nr:hypothetical protein [Rheinheimera baltica]MDP5136067.1 hypothetical protein [Rheinheimera baltica]